MRVLGLDEILEEIRLVCVEIFVLALQAGGHHLDGDASNAGNVGGSQGVEGVLIQPVVHPGHLSTHAQVVDGLVGDGQSPVKVAALLQVPELLAESHCSKEVPGVWIRAGQLQVTTAKDAQRFAKCKSITTHSRRASRPVCTPCPAQRIAAGDGCKSP